jgi:hypothetical protein
MYLLLEIQVKENIINYDMIKHILESSFESLDKVAGFERVKSVKRSMIEIFGQVFVDLCQGYHLGGKIKLDKIGKRSLSDEVSRLLDWMDENFSETLTIQSVQILRHYQNEREPSSKRSSVTICNNKIEPQDSRPASPEKEQIKTIFDLCFICTPFLK